MYVCVTTEIVTMNAVLFEADQTLRPSSEEISVLIPLVCLGSVYQYGQ